MQFGRYLFVPDGPRPDAFLIEKAHLLSRGELSEPVHQLLPLPCLNVVEERFGEVIGGRGRCHITILASGTVETQVLTCVVLIRHAVARIWQ